MAVVAMFWLCDKAARFLKYIWIFSPVNPIVCKITHARTRKEWEDHFWSSFFVPHRV
jgi:hypothetical protein